VDPAESLGGDVSANAADSGRAAVATQINLSIDDAPFQH
jgi:hypothetical protein